MSSENDVRKQIEFYFSDSNIVRDRHLKLRISKHPEGYVELSHLLTFNRLKALTTDIDVVRAALRTSTVVELNEDETLVRRRDPLPSDTSFIDDRTVYAKEFPKDITIDVLLAFWNEHAKIRGVFMRRERGNKAFKGSVFVECESPEEAQKLAQSEIEYEGTKLTLMLKHDWVEMKKAEHGVASSSSSSAVASSSSAHDAEDEEGDEEDEAFTPGLIVCLTDVPAGVSRNEIQNALSPCGDVRFVDFEAGATKALARFADAASASKAIEAASSSDGLCIGEAKLAASLLEGDEERAYWSEIQRSRKAKQNARGNRKRGRDSTPSRRGRGRGRGRGGSAHGSGEPSEKRSKAAAASSDE